MTRDELTQRREALEKERDALVTEANRQIAFLTGQIALLTELTAAEDNPPAVTSLNGVAVGEHYEPVEV
jgi:hypothetical protein